MPSQVDPKMKKALGVALSANIVATNATDNVTNVIDEKINVIDDVVDELAEMDAE